MLRDLFEKFSIIYLYCKNYIGTLLVLRKRLSAGFKGLSSASENELDREHIFGFLMLCLMLMVGEFGVSYIVDDFSVEVVSDKSLLFLSFVSMHDKLNTEELKADSPITCTEFFGLCYFD
jgi:hypothetical protein